MNASVRLGPIAGVEVGLHWSLAIVFVLIVWTLAGQILPSVVPDQPQSAPRPLRNHHFLAGCHRRPALVEGACAWLAGSNAPLLLFNLMPTFPLDGGRLLRPWLWQRSHDRYRTNSSAARLGRIYAFLMIALGLALLFLQGALSGLWLIFLGWLLLSAARGEEVQVLLRARSRPSTETSTASSP